MNPERPKNQPSRQTGWLQSAEIPKSTQPKLIDNFDAPRHHSHEKETAHETILEKIKHNPAWRTVISGALMVAIAGSIAFHATNITTGNTQAKENRIEKLTDVNKFDAHGAAKVKIGNENVNVRNSETVKDDSAGNTNKIGHIDAGQEFEVAHYFTLTSEHTKGAGPNGTVYCFLANELPEGVYQQDATHTAQEPVLYIFSGADNTNLSVEDLPNQES